MDKEKAIKVCEAISADTEKDINEMEGAPFTGETVATHFGYQAAAIKALAEILKELIEESKQAKLWHTV
jgi:hypothetical protein